MCGRVRSGDREGDGMDVQCTRLDNGVRVVTAALPHVESAAIGFWVGVGARYESARISGMSHLIEHLLFKGTRKRKAVEISQAIEGRGGYLNAFTQQEATCYFAMVGYDKVWEAAEVLADMYISPLFASAELDKERGVIIEEIMMYRDVPQHAVHEMLYEGLWKRHPLGRPIAGNPKSISGVSRKDIVGYKSKTYSGDNTVVSLAGRVDHETCVRKIRTLTRRLQPRKTPSFRGVSRSIGQERVVLEERAIEQAHLALAFRLFGRRDRRRYALQVLSAVLGENMSSRLFQIVREKHGLAYSVHSSVDLFFDTGALTVSAGVDRQRSHKALKLILRELARIREKKVGSRELERARDYIVGQTRLGLESTSQQMMWVGNNMIFHGRFIPPAEVVARVQRVSAADVQAVAGAVIDKRRATLAMIGPDLGTGAQAECRAMLDRL